MINQLPMEILVNILEYLPHHTNKKVWKKLFRNYPIPTRSMKLFTLEIQDNMEIINLDNLGRLQAIPPTPLLGILKEGDGFHTTNSLFLDIFNILLSNKKMHDNLRKSETFRRLWHRLKYAHYAALAAVLRDFEINEQDPYTYGL